MIYFGGGGGVGDLWWRVDAWWGGQLWATGIDSGKLRGALDSGGLTAVDQNQDNGGPREGPGRDRQL